MFLVFSEYRVRFNIRHTRTNDIQWALRMLDIKPGQFEINRVKASFRNLQKLYHPDKVPNVDKMNPVIVLEYTKFSAIISNANEICTKVWKRMHPEAIFSPFSPTPRGQYSNVVPARSRWDASPPPGTGKGSSGLRFSSPPTGIYVPSPPPTAA